ncbi:Alpha-1,6-mannosylglycoprotein 6-beta-N-acetylglucosaminyltransferase B [Ameca splendens]|uniref:Alpha-1,6-mannosylglycoprotein 6-beta-N-acetylglucosaminyltransferase B n=1 Tax=Ameca splendens TaxID=208324 RepID=A0ABV0XD00_9TELE
MVRRCLVTFKPFRIFVVGVGFFSLCFLMTSLGGQFSAKRLGDSPFTIRTEGNDMCCVFVCEQIFRSE